jgi:hypothetical protein
MAEKHTIPYDVVSRIRRDTGNSGIKTFKAGSFKRRLRTLSLLSVHLVLLKETARIPRQVWLGPCIIQELIDALACPSYFIILSGCGSRIDRRSGRR